MQRSALHKDSILLAVRAEQGEKELGKAEEGRRGVRRSTAEGALVPAEHRPEVKGAALEVERMGRTVVGGEVVLTHVGCIEQIAQRSIERQPRATEGHVAEDLQVQPLVVRPTLPA